MNKIKYLGVALAATLAACSTNDFDSVPAVNGNGMITAITPTGSGTTTRTSYSQDGSDLAVTWNASDEKMYTLNTTAEGWTAGQLVQADAATDNNTKANFNAYDVEGTKQVGYKAGKLFAFYPQNATTASSFKNLASDGTSVSVPLTLDSQTGKLADLSKYDYMTATTDVTVNANGEATVSPLQMNHEIAVLHLAKGMETLAEAGNVTKVELSATSGLYGSGSMTVSRTGSAITSSVVGTSGTITLNGDFAIEDGKLSEDIYVAVLSTTSFSGLKAKFTYSNGDSYTYAYSGSINQFVKGKMYNWTPEIAAEDKGFSISNLKFVTGHKYTTQTNENKNGFSYTGKGTMTIKTIEDDETNVSGSKEKATFVITLNNGSVSKAASFELASITGIYPLWKNEVVDIEKESFKLVGWYTNANCSGTPQATPDATHIYGLCELVFPDLKADASDYYKILQKNLTVTMKNSFGVSKSYTLNKYYIIMVWYTFDKTNYPVQTITYIYKIPGGTKSITKKAYDALRNSF